MEFIGHFRRLNAAQRNTFLACFLGWSLDAFDFFVMLGVVAGVLAIRRQGIYFTMITLALAQMRCAWRTMPPATWSAASITRATCATCSTRPPRRAW